jgi:integrase
MRIHKTERRQKKTGKNTVRWRADAGKDAKTGKRLRKSFESYAKAKAWLGNLAHASKAMVSFESADVAEGMTLSQIGARFVANRISAKRERSTTDKYDQHFKQHVSKLAFEFRDGDRSEDELRDGTIFGDMVAAQMRPRHFIRLREQLSETRSHAMTRKVWSTLTAALDLAVQFEDVPANLLHSIKIDRQARTTADKIVIPTRPEIATIIEATRPQQGEPIYIGQAMIALTLTTGLRPSEMRALPLLCLFVEQPPYRVVVTTRVDQWKQEGPPKSAAGYREIPLPESTARLMREWLLRRPKAGSKNLVFPNGDGGYQDLSNIHARIWRPFQINIGLADPKLDANGKPVLDPKTKQPVMVPRYTWYANRHAYASMQIAIGIQPKELQQRMGHASIQMTMDLYGHLWRDEAQDAADMRALDVFMMGMKGAD